MTTDSKILCYSFICDASKNRWCQTLVVKSRLSMVETNIAFISLGVRVALAHSFPVFSLVSALWKIVILCDFYLGQRYEKVLRSSDLVC